MTRCIDDYEPGATAESLGAMFERMRPRLVALREAVLGAAAQPPALEGRFGAEGQIAPGARSGHRLWL